MLGAAAYEAERCKSIRAVCLGRPNRVVAETLSQRDFLIRDNDLRLRVINGYAEFYLADDFTPLVFASATAGNGVSFGFSLMVFAIATAGNGASFLCSDKKTRLKKTRRPPPHLGIH